MRDYDLNRLSSLEVRMGLSMSVAAETFIMNGGQGLMDQDFIQQ